MKVLITGIEGYIGTVLGQVLLNQGFNVVGLDTGYYREGWFFKGIKHFPKIISKDIRTIKEDDLKGYNTVVHLAELSNDPLGEINSEVTYEINHQGTVTLAKKSKKMGIKRFIYFSSCSVYGASEDVVDEKTKPNPLTVYAQCKVLNEKSLLAMADDNFSPVILRLATVFGPSPRMRFDLAVNNLAGLAWTTKEIKMESDGNPWRPFVHILDVCEAVACILKANKNVVHGQIFNLGSQKSNHQIKDIAAIIGKVFVGCQVSLNKNGIDKRNYRVNFEKINNRLPGFSCKRTVETGIQELSEIFKQIKLSKEIFASRNFTRLKQLQYLRQTKQIDSKFYWR